MKIAVAVLGIVGGLAQLGIVSNGSLFEPSPTPAAGIGLAIAGVVGAVLAFKKLKLGGIIMLISGMACSWVMVAALRAANATPGPAGHAALPGLFPIAIVLSIFGNALLIVAGTLALVSRRTQPISTVRR